MEVTNNIDTPGGTVIWDSANTRIGQNLVDTTSIDESIAPTWTSTHSFTGAPALDLGGNLSFSSGYQVNSVESIDSDGRGNLAISRNNSNKIILNSTGDIDLRGNIDFTGQFIDYKTNPGAETLADMTVDGNATAGTEQSIATNVDATTIMKAYAESDGTGGIQNAAVQLFQELDARGQSISDANSVGFNDSDGLGGTWSMFETSGGALRVNHGNGGASIDIAEGGAVDILSGPLNLTAGDLQRNGTTVVTTQQSAIASLTDNTGGATDGTLAAVSGSGDDATINNNLAELNSKVDSILSALRTHGLINT